MKYYVETLMGQIYEVNSVYNGPNSCLWTLSEDRNHYHAPLEDIEYVLRTNSEHTKRMLEFRMDGEPVCSLDQVRQIWMEE